MVAAQADEGGGEPGRSLLESPGLTSGSDTPQQDSKCGGIPPWGRGLRPPSASPVGGLSTGLGGTGPAGFSPPSTPLSLHPSLYPPIPSSLPPSTPFSIPPSLHPSLHPSLPPSPSIPSELGAPRRSGWDPPSHFPTALPSQTARGDLRRRKTEPPATSCPLFPGSGHPRPRLPWRWGRGAALRGIFRAQRYERGEVGAQISPPDPLLPSFRLKYK